MTSAIPTGFLVVLSMPAHVNRRNSRYKGINRIPAYPSKYPGEASAMDDYVFGGFKDSDTNVIPSFARAFELWTRLSSSERSYDIVVCSAGPLDREEKVALVDTYAQITPLGYDISNLDSDYWSIVDDFARSAWSDLYMMRLNEYGLFNNRVDADQYMSEYRNHGEADCDVPFKIVFVSRVDSTASSIAWPALPMLWGMSFCILMIGAAILSASAM